MGERKGTNKYYPPDYDPAKGGLNAYHGTHALRERARKLHEGILIIRFEMPYNIWCNGCGKHIGMGVRYNAQKRKMGYYYTTPIYKFRMKCHLCDQHFEIQTDPKNCDYQILSGARRKEERWDTEKAGNVQTTHREVKEKLMTDAMYKLEHSASDQGKARKVAPTLTRLEDIRDAWKDDFAVNQALRHKFRTEKKEIVAENLADDDFKKRTNLPEDMSLVKEREEDKEKAQRMRYGEESQNPDVLRNFRKRKIKSASIFGLSTDAKVELAKTLASSGTKKTNDTNSSKMLSPLSLGIKIKKRSSSSSSESANTSSEMKVIDGDNVREGDDMHIKTDDRTRIGVETTQLLNTSDARESERTSEATMSNEITSNLTTPEQGNSTRRNSILVDYNSSSGDDET